MKITIESKPTTKILYYKGNVKIDVSELDEVANIETYDFELVSNTNEDIVVWLDKEPNVTNIENLERKIIIQFYKTL